MSSNIKNKLVTIRPNLMRPSCEENWNNNEKTLDDNLKKGDKEVCLETTTIMRVLLTI
jgi:hypothetical protein